MRYILAFLVVTAGFAFLSGDGRGPAVASGCYASASATAVAVGGGCNAGYAVATGCHRDPLLGRLRARRMRGCSGCAGVALAQPVMLVEPCACSCSHAAPVQIVQPQPIIGWRVTFTPVALDPCGRPIAEQPAQQSAVEAPQGDAPVTISPPE